MGSLISRLEDRFYVEKPIPSVFNFPPGVYKYSHPCVPALVCSPRRKMFCKYSSGGGSAIEKPAIRTRFFMSYSQRAAVTVLYRSRQFPISRLSTTIFNQQEMGQPRVYNLPPLGAGFSRQRDQKTARREETPVTTV